MKTIVEILKIVGFSLILGLIILVLTLNKHFSCSALDAFSGESWVMLFFEGLKDLLLAFVIWIFGFVIYFMIKKKKQINLLLYFSFITTISLHAFIIKAINRAPEENVEIKQEICKKSTDDRMMLTFENLNKPEYDFINSKTNWLPSIPNNADSINISYYRDDFIGDYHLIINLVIPSGQKLDSIEYPNWVLNGTQYKFEELEY